MSQLHSIQTLVKFNLHPRDIITPLESLNAILSERLNRFLPEFNGYLVAFSGLEMASEKASITQFSANLIAQATASLLVFVPKGKFVAENRHNCSLGRGMFPLDNQSLNDEEICICRGFKDGKMQVEWMSKSE